MITVLYPPFITGVKARRTATDQTGRQRFVLDEADTVLCVYACLAASHARSSRPHRDMPLPTLLFLLGSTIKLDSSPYHVLYADDAHPCFRKRDIHRLTGSIDSDRGGDLEAHVDNGTAPDYKLSLSAAEQHNHNVHNVTGAISCRGKTIQLTGHALLENFTSWELLQISFVAAPPSLRLSAILSKGGNPPPPPPSPPKCATTGAANQSACDAVNFSNGTSNACAWCVSKDRVHSLCFVATHKPEAGSWDCDR